MDVSELMSNYTEEGIRELFKKNGLENITKITFEADDTIIFEISYDEMEYGGEEYDWGEYAGLDEPAYVGITPRALKIILVKFVLILE